MRLGVLDVGSHTVHLLVVDASRGVFPWPAHSQRVALRLAEKLGPEGAISPANEQALLAAVTDAAAAATRLQAEELLAFATSTLRDAQNGPQVLSQVRRQAGVALQVLSGEQEARVTFLAVRRWFGWSAGRLLVIDIGGGSLELAAGIDEDPDVALSLPLGAGRLTREHLGGIDPPAGEDVVALTSQVETVLEPAAGMLAAVPWDRVVVTSKTFRTLARLAGAASHRAGLWQPRQLSATDLDRVLGFIRHIPVSALARMDGVSSHRAGQLLAGAVVAQVVFRRLGIQAAQVCPWALREGMILRRLDDSVR